MEIAMQIKVVNHFDKLVSTNQFLTFHSLISK